MKNVPRSKRAELSRLVVVPYAEGKYLPRNLVMLMFIRNLVIWGEERGIEAGYSFVKEKLAKKLNNLKAPVHYIESFKQTYPTGGVLYRYFNQAEDRALPIYFTVPEFREFVDHILENSWMFEKQSDKVFILKNNLYNKFLRRMRIM